MCEKVCPSKCIVKTSIDTKYPIAYGGWHKDDAVRADSSSGGAFTLLAEAILAEGGVVFGCTLDSENRAVYKSVETIELLSELRGSKYVQSEIRETYEEIRTALKNNRKVLFVGTPCQAAGLYAFMGNCKSEGLYIVDFICHGVPSPQIFQAYITDQEKRQGSKVVSHRFRNKDYGWNQSGLQLGTRTQFADGTVIRRYPALTDSYMNGFLDDIYLRPSCYACKFKVVHKYYSDFTIADFWGIDKVAPEMNDKKGTSLVLVNTEHAHKLWDQIKDGFVYKEVEIADAIRRNKSLVESARMNPNRKNFFDDYAGKGFKYVERKYMSAFIWECIICLHTHLLFL